MKININARPPKDWADEKIRSLDSRVRQILSEEVKGGEGMTKEFIATRGTPESGKQGRIRTGKMIDSVKSQDRVDQPGQYLGAFGWIDTQEDYFRYQEEGFFHVNAGVNIPGMYALQDASYQAWLQARNRIDEELKRA